MDMKERAELVRAIRCESKQRRQGVRATPLYDAPNFRGESADWVAAERRRGRDGRTPDGHATFNAGGDRHARVLRHGRINAPWERIGDPDGNGPAPKRYKQAAPEHVRLRDREGFRALRRSENFADAGAGGPKRPPNSAFAVNAPGARASGRNSHGHEATRRTSPRHSC